MAIYSSLYGPLFLSRRFLYYNVTNALETAILCNLRLSFHHVAQITQRRKAKIILERVPITQTAEPNRYKDFALIQSSYATLILGTFVRLLLLPKTRCILQMKAK